MKVHKLDKPPIREAIFDVVLDFSTPISIEALEGFEEAVKNQFPIKKDIFQFQGQLSVIDTTATSVNKTRIGIAYSDQSNNTLIQTRLNGFSFSQLNKTYESWEDFHPRAFEWLYKFTNYIGATSANRISLRFINEIGIPLPITDLREYITMSPEWNGELKLPFNNLFMRLELPSTEYDAVAVIQEAISPPFIDTLNLFFDIDVIKANKTIDIKEEYLKPEFDSLRDFKNSIFFGSLTDKAESLFKN